MKSLKIFQAILIIIAILPFLVRFFPRVINVYKNTLVIEFKNHDLFNWIAEVIYLALVIGGSLMWFFWFNTSRLPNIFVLIGMNHHLVTEQITASLAHMYCIPKFLKSDDLFLRFFVIVLLCSVNEILYVNTKFKQWLFIACNLIFFIYVEILYYKQHRIPLKFTWDVPLQIAILGFLKIFLINIIKKDIEPKEVKFDLVKAMSILILIGPHMNSCLKNDVNLISIYDLFSIISAFIFVTCSQLEVTSLVCILYSLGFSIFSLTFYCATETSEEFSIFFIVDHLALCSCMLLAFIYYAVVIVTENNNKKSKRISVSSKSSTKSSIQKLNEEGKSQNESFSSSDNNTDSNNKNNKIHPNLFKQYNQLASVHNNHPITSKSNSKK